MRWKFSYKFSFTYWTASVRVSIWTRGRWCSCSSSSASAPRTKVRTDKSPLACLALLKAHFLNHRAPYILIDRWKDTTWLWMVWFRFLLRLGNISVSPLRVFDAGFWWSAFVFPWRGCWAGGVQCASGGRFSAQSSVCGTNECPAALLFTFLCTVLLLRSSLMILNTQEIYFPEECKHDDEWIETSSQLHNDGHSHQTPKCSGSIFSYVNINI